MVIPKTDQIKWPVIVQILPEIYQDFTYNSDQIKPKIDDIVKKI
jgi:hypothetical protein